MDVLLGHAGGAEVAQHQLGPRPRAADEDVTLGDGVDTATDLAALTAWVPDVADRDVYVCGPGPWADLVLRDLRAAGVPDDHIHLENFGW